MQTLFDKLKDFDKKINASTNETNLDDYFRVLAPSFLYGGYIQVRNDYRVYIRTVEFYFHSEEKGVKDPIVYHRNGRELKNVPYFPLMSLHAHQSGIDITFESEEKQYRASALIRAYEVKNKEENYLVWDIEKENAESQDNKKKFIENVEYGYNTQSTYLYALLNGFALGNENGIKWVDESRAHNKEITQKTRQNVFQSKDENEYKPIKDKRCNRKWGFTRQEEV